MWPLLPLRVILERNKNLDLSGRKKLGYAYKWQKVKENEINKCSEGEMARVKKYDNLW